MAFDAATTAAAALAGKGNDSCYNFHRPVTRLSLVPPDEHTRHYTTRPSVHVRVDQHTRLRHIIGQIVAVRSHSRAGWD